LFYFHEIFDGYQLKLFILPADFSGGECFAVIYAPTYCGLLPGASRIKWRQNKGVFILGRLM
jgi:hypothetical protein